MHNNYCCSQKRTGSRGPSGRSQQHCTGQGKFSTPRVGDQSLLPCLWLLCPVGLSHPPALRYTGFGQQEGSALLPFPTPGTTSSTTLTIPQSSAVFPLVGADGSSTGSRPVSSCPGTQQENEVNRMALQQGPEHPWPQMPTSALSLLQAFTCTALGVTHTGRQRYLQLAKRCLITALMNGIEPL